MGIPAKQESSGETGWSTATRSSFEKLGRNDLCPCGSGRRFQVLPEERALRWVPQELLLTRLIATIPSCGLARLLARLASLDALAEFAVPAFCAVENPGTCPRGPLMSTGGSLDPLADHRCAGASTPHSQYLPHLRQPQCSYWLTVAGKDLSTSVGPSPEARSRASEGSGATNQWAVLLRASRAPSGCSEGNPDGS